MKEVIIYTDGACSGNPGPGGWGAVLYYGDTKKEIYGGEKLSTNNKMELQAAIEALKILKKNLSVKVILYTDSSYVKNGITSWIANWEKNNWRTSSKAPVKNKELWFELNELNKSLDIEWRWIKGHSGNEGNEIADTLARKGILELEE